MLSSARRPAVAAIDLASTSAHCNCVGRAAAMATRPGTTALAMAARSGRSSSQTSAASRRSLSVSAPAQASESMLFGPRSPLFDRNQAAHAVRHKLLQRVSQSPEAQAAMVDILGALQRKGSGGKLLGRGSPGQGHAISLESVLGQLDTLKGDPDFTAAITRLMNALGDTTVGDTLSLLLKKPGKVPPKQP